MVKQLQEAILWQKERNGIRCFSCARRCFISKDKRGYCQVRINKNNKLYTMNYGKIVNIDITTIEKNHMFHFIPASNTMSIFVPGTNFPYVNLPVEMKVFKDKDQTEVFGDDYTPEKIVTIAEKKGCSTISYTYSEPAIYMEFSFRAAKLAHRSNIKNVFVTNGYMGGDAAKKIAKYLDAAVFNFIASGDPEFYSKFEDVKNTDPIFDTLKQMKKHRIFVEITNLIIPQIGDDTEQCKKLAQWVSTELGSEIPFHIVQFYPDYKFSELPPTPVSTLERCADEARRTGLRYVYIDNVPEHLDVNTYCYNCRELLIKRDGLSLKKNNLVKDRCPNCGVRINVVAE